jgi:predicted DNA-binding transcriptional regulator YafY
MIALFFTVDSPNRWQTMPAAIIFSILTFAGLKLKEFKKKKPATNIAATPHWEEKNKNDEEEVEYHIEMPEEDEPDIADAAFAATTRERKQFDVEKGMYRLVYIDAEGESTARNIKLIRVDRGEPGRIYAYCFLRKENRSFRIDRIVALYKGDKPIKDPKKYLYGLSIDDLASEALGDG